MRASVAIVALVTGCWRDTPPQPERVDPPPPAPAPARTSHHSEWQGEYTCPQGLTGVRLSLDVARSGDATATFEFSAVPANPGVPHGSYRMRGKLKMIDASAFELALAPDRWIEQPPGWFMVGLTATSDRERRSLTGRIDDTRCGNIWMSRL